MTTGGANEYVANMGEYDWKTFRLKIPQFRDRVDAP